MNVKVTVNGVTFEGSKEDVQKLLENVGYMRKGDRYYYSQTHGLMPIKKMHTNHVMNATLKMYREWVAGLSNETDPKALYKKILTGPDEPAWTDLVVELSKREEEPVVTKF